MLQSSTLSDHRRRGQELLWGFLGGKARQVLTMLLNAFMEDERTASLGAGRHERSCRRRGHRNGYFRRALDSLFGRLALDVPKVRSGGFRTLVFEAYGRRQEEVNEAIRQWVARGLSTRSVAKALQDAFGVVVSAATVSSVVAQIDAELEAFHKRSLASGYRFLFLDGKHGYTSRPRRRRGRGKKAESALLLAWGVRRDGAEELVDFLVADGETEQNWTSLLTSLEARGLKARNELGQPLEMIVSDGDQAIEAAKLMVYPTVPHQRCAFHKIKNIADHLRCRANRETILAEAASIYRDLRTAPEALKRLDDWSERWKVVEPAAVANFRADFELTLRYLNVDPAWRNRVKTTNPLERFIRELDRKIERVEVFPSPKSWERCTYLCWKELKTGGYAPTKPKYQKHSFTPRY